MKQLLGIMAITLGYGQEHSFIVHLLITVVLMCFAQLWFFAKVATLVFFLSGIVLQVLGSMVLDNVAVDVLGA